MGSPGGLRTGDKLRECTFPHTLLSAKVAGSEGKQSRALQEIKHLPSMWGALGSVSRTVQTD